MRFEEFAAARSPALLRYAMLLSGDREQARDLVQEVLTRALVKWRRVEGTDEPYAYVRRMLTNEYLSWRRRRRVPTVPLLDTLDRHAGDAPAADGLIEGAYAGAARIHRRRKITATVTAAVAVVAVAAGLPLARHLESAPPLPVTNGPRTETRSTVTVDPDADFVVWGRQSTIDRQTLYVDRNGNATDGEPNYTVVVQSEDRFKPADLPAGEPVRVGDHDARLLPSLRKDNGGVPNTLSLAWQNTDGSWVTIAPDHDGDKETLLALGAALRGSEPEPVIGPFQLTTTPPGFAVRQVSTRAVEVMLLAAPDARVFGDSAIDYVKGGVIVELEMRNADNDKFLSELGPATDTVQGSPAWYSIGRTSKSGNFYLRTATCHVRVWTRDHADFPREDAKRLLESARIGACDSKDGWGPVAP
ncbi:sigma factor [Symbioplanes lichenis]|uniref:sigma factor n=1 Tax=Symbioplanes lichenis TaxID=1629072 RepID=UPI0034DB6301